MKDHVSCLGILAGILKLAVELRHLRYFVAVAETENVSRAALKTSRLASGASAGRFAISKMRPGSNYLSAPRSRSA